MSSTQQLIFNCGGSHVSATLATVQPASVTFDGFAVEPLDYDASAEDQWLSAVAGAVRRLAGRGFKGKASIILPGFQLLTRTLKVPHVEAQRQAQVIAYEASNNMPYALHEVSWGYQIVHDDGVEVEVLLIFARRELVDGVCSAFIQAGISPMHVQAGSLMDLAGLRFLSGGDTGNALLINLGARSTNLLFASSETFLIRTITTGGNSLTQNIADNLGRPAAEAEALKIDAQELDERGDDPATATIVQNQTEAFIKKLNQEIKRSMVNFRRQPGASAPERIVICGRGAKLHGIVRSLEAAHKLSVETLDPTESIQTGGKVDQAALNVFRLSTVEIIGEATRIVDPQAPTVNLLPGDLQREMAFAKQKPFFAAAAAILALAAVPPLLYFGQAAAVAENQREELQGEIAPLRERHGQIVEIGEQAQIVADKINQLQRLVSTRSNWIAFLADLQRSLQQTEHVWLEALNWQGDTAERLQISGRILIFDWDPDDPTGSYQRAEQRFSALMNSFTSSDFIAGIENTRIDPDQPRILGFSATLV
ncbi:MAG: pilus assembly protein PilM, partial [Opitutales bacterium]